MGSFTTNRRCAYYQPVIDEELLELDTKAVALFNRAVYAGDMRVAKLLHARFGMNVFGQNAEEQTALHIACQQGHPEMFKWLIDQIGIDLVKSDNLNRREIHHAVTRCNPDILKMRCSNLRSTWTAGQKVDRRHWI